MTQEDIIIYATAKSEEAPPREHYFYAYQFSDGGMWFNTTISPSIEEAKKSLTFQTKPIHRKKLCCIAL